MRIIAGYTRAGHRLIGTWRKSCSLPQCRYYQGQAHQHYAHVYFPTHWKLDKIEPWLKALEPQIKQAARTLSCASFRLRPPRTKSKER